MTAPHVRTPNPQSGRLEEQRMARTDTSLEDLRFPRPYPYFPDLTSRNPRTTPIIPRYIPAILVPHLHPQSHSCHRHRIPRSLNQKLILKGRRFHHFVGSCERQALLVSGQTCTAGGGSRR